MAIQLKNSGEHQRHHIAVGGGAGRIIFVGVVELAAQVFHGLPHDARRVVGLARGALRGVFEERIVAHHGHQRRRHAPPADGVPAVAVEFAARGKPRRAADPLGAHDQRSLVVAGARTVADALEVVGAILAPIVGTGDLQSPDGTQRQPRHKVLRFVLVLDVQPFAVEHAEVVAQNTVPFAIEEPAVEHGAHVAARGRESAHVVEAHQPAQRQRVFDELVLEGHVVGILDRKGQFVLSQLEIQLFERPVADVGVDDFRAAELDLHPVVEFFGDVARKVQAHALDEEGRGGFRPLVAGLHVARDPGQAGCNLIPGRSPGFERFELGRKFGDGGFARCGRGSRFPGECPEREQRQQQYNNRFHWQ